MATRTIKAGTANQIITVTMRDSTTGALKTALAFGDVTYAYTREGDNARANGTCVDATLDAYTSAGWKLVSDANQPGKYQFGVPAAMIAAGAIKATVTFRAAGAIDQVEHVLLTAVDLQDGVRIGTTALPNAVPGANGGLPTTNGTKVNQTVDLTAGQTIAATVAAGAIAANALTASALATDAVTEIANGLLDSLNTGAQHNIANSVGRQIRQGAGTAAATILSGTCQAGSGTATIVLSGAASGTNNIYNGATVVITGGVGVGQTRRIVSYVGATKTATVDRAWVTIPTNTSTFDLVAGNTSIISAEGLAQAGGASSITLATTASAYDDIYNGSLVTIESGTGVGQTEVITDYTGLTRVASIAPVAWSVQPAGDSVYAVIPAGDAVGDNAQGAATLTAQDVRDAMRLIPSPQPIGSDSIDAHLDTIISATTAQVIRDTMKLAPTAGAPAAGSIDKELDDLVLGGGSITPQQVRDAMKLAPTAGAPAAGSVDDHLDDMPSDVWAWTPRTLTSTAAATTAAVVGSDVTVQRGDTVQISLTGLGNISTRTKLWFGLKGDLSDPDTGAKVLLEETAGLTVVNGAAYATTTDATLVVTNAVTGALTITIKPAVTGVLVPCNNAFYDLQWKDATGGIFTLTAGAATVTGDVVRAVS